MILAGDCDKSFTRPRPGVLSWRSDWRSLPFTSLRPVDLVVTELAVIAFPGGRATLVETAPGITAENVIASTEAELDVPGKVPQMNL